MKKLRLLHPCSRPLTDFWRWSWILNQSLWLFWYMWTKLHSLKITMRSQLFWCFKVKNKNQLFTFKIIKWFNLIKCLWGFFSLLSVCFLSVTSLSPFSPRRLCNLLSLRDLPYISVPSNPPLILIFYCTFWTILWLLCLSLLIKGHFIIFILYPEVFSVFWTPALSVLSISLTAMTSNSIHPKLKLMLSHQQKSVPSFECSISVLIYAPHSSICPNKIPESYFSVHILSPFMFNQ